jgi:hypothetical protein
MGFSDGGIRMVRLSCESKISFDGNKIKFGGVTLPATHSGDTIKIGDINIEPTLVRQASDMIEALDNFQMEYCQALMVITSDTLRMHLLDQNDKLNQTIVQFIGNLKTANNQTDYQNAVVKADSSKAHLKSVSQITSNISSN